MQQYQKKVTLIWICKHQTGGGGGGRLPAAWDVIILSFMNSCVQGHTDTSCETGTTAWCRVNYPAPPFHTLPNRWDSSSGCRLLAVIPDGTRQSLVVSCEATRRRKHRHYWLAASALLDAICLSQAGPELPGREEWSPRPRRALLSMLDFVYLLVYSNCHLVNCLLRAWPRRRSRPPFQNPTWVPYTIFFFVALLDGAKRGASRHVTWCI